VAKDDGTGTLTAGVIAALRQAKSVFVLTGREFRRRAACRRFAALAVFGERIALKSWLRPRDSLAIRF
jgi:hypothetical protein